MPCDTKPFRRNQTLAQRKEEVKKITDQVASNLAAGKVKPVVNKSTGAIAFQGITDEERGGITDACMYRRIIATGSSAAKLAIARAEQLAGRTVNRQALAQGHHSHDGGHTWHSGH